MKTHTKITALIFAFIIGFSCFLGCANFPKKQKTDEERALFYLLEHSKIELPDDAQIVYFIFKEPEGFKFYYFQYVVFQLENEPNDWLKANSFNDSTNQEKSETFKTSFMTMMNWLPGEYEGKIPQEFFPDFEGLYYYFVTPYEKFFLRNVYFVYLPESSLLITMMLS